MCEFKEPEDLTIYGLIKTRESAHILSRAVDDDVASESIYLDELNFWLQPFGVIVLDVEMPDNPTGALISEARRVGLTDAA